MIPNLSWLTYKADKSCHPVKGLSPTEESILSSINMEFEDRGTKRKHGDESEAEDSKLSSMDVDEHGDLTH
ncbi:hypothetical protein V6N12_019904 [Hibiscus sabdariffa]|uniref:Uncharacterized protein n=1 Tax=Hibiscus sabdariffa TaxID=183260 RepID=A0ABR1ZFT0_9ROSI